MGGYVGSELQQRLQQQSDESAPLTLTRPGACNVGRMIGCDDIAAFGWPAVFDVLERDDVIGFRMVAADQLPDITERLASKGFRLDLWDVFTASAADALPMTQQILPKGFLQT